jgi:hypothetical protein
MKLITTLSAVLIATLTVPALAAPAPDKDDLEPLDTAAWYVAAIDAGKLKPGQGQSQGELADYVRMCSDRVKNLFDRHFEPSTKLDLQGKSYTLDHVDADVCQTLGARIKGWDDRAAATVAAANDAELEPYRKAGVAGDKLKLVNDLGQQLIGPRQAKATPSVVAHANVLFSLRHDDYRVWTIVRYAFSGNKQVSVTEKGYRDQPGPDQFR